MNLSFDFFDKFGILTNTFSFFRKHFLIILTLGLVAAMGRVIQLGGFGKIDKTWHIILEVVVESARILLFLFVLGLGNVKTGTFRLTHVARQKATRKKLLATVRHEFKRQSLSFFLNIAGLLLFAWAINYLIDLLAYQTCFYINLKKEGILVEASSEWTILLFFKNLTVIPMTLIFDTLLLLWLTKKLPYNRKITLV